jgi:hypothetical protein
MLLSQIVFIVLQIILIFIFLTLFFFLYVTNIEKQEFATQLDIIVDDLLQDVDFSKLVPQSITPSDAILLIDGSLDVIINKVTQESTAENKIISKKNKLLILNIFIIILSLIIIVISFIFFSLYKGYNIPFFKHIKDGLISVLFVAITELFFLQIITKNYISAQPNHIRNTLSNAIINYVQNRNPLPIKPLQQSKYFFTN